MTQIRRNRLTTSGTIKEPTPTRIATPIMAPTNRVTSCTEAPAAIALNVPV